MRRNLFIIEIFYLEYPGEKENMEMSGSWKFFREIRVMSRNLKFESPEFEKKSAA